MAKKSPSASKKTAKVVTKSSAKKAAPPAKKAVAKAAAKAVKKVTPKTVKKPALRPVKKPVVAAKPATNKVISKSLEAQTKSKTSLLPLVAKKDESMKAVKPALMTKKGKPTLEVESEDAHQEAGSIDAAPQKAEKASKVKPIRIEKGNTEDEKAKWAELFKKYGKDNAIPYKMSDSFPSLSPLQHKVLGWGFILKNDNDRLEVLFETGIRMLISNYKS